MKKFLSVILLLAVTMPVFAITEVAKISKEDIKYQKKVEKIKRKQELKCLKRPDFCSPAQDTQLTLGIAQKNVKVGSSQEDVISALGSPNIVTTDSDGKETWIYDKVSSVTSYNNSGFGVGIILAGYGKERGNMQSAQKTLTIIIKFNNNQVEAFKYHMSSF